MRKNWAVGNEAPVLLQRSLICLDCQLCETTHQTYFELSLCLNDPLLIYLGTGIFPLWATCKMLLKSVSAVDPRFKMSTGYIAVYRNQSACLARLS